MIQEKASIFCQHNNRMFFLLLLLLSEKRAKEYIFLRNKYWKTNSSRIRDVVKKRLASQKIDIFLMRASILRFRIFCITFPIAKLRTNFKIDTYLGEIHVCLYCMFYMLIPSLHLHSYRQSYYEDISNSCQSRRCFQEQTTAKY